MRKTIRQSNIRNRTELKLEDIARMYNLVIRGWLEYYGKYYPSALYPFCRFFNRMMVAWIMKKYKKLKVRKIKSSNLLESIQKKKPSLFEHWKRGMIGAFA